MGKLMSRSGQQGGGDPGQGLPWKPEVAMLLGGRLSTRGRKMTLVYCNIEAFGDTDKFWFWCCAAGPLAKWIVDIV